MNVVTEAVRRSAANNPLDFDAIVIGAGVSGLYQLYRLRVMIFEHRIVEILRHTVLGR